jgi:hypothetical protein
MFKPNDAKCTRAFWSIDAAFAIVLSVAMFAMFSSVLYSASHLALNGADETSGILLSARFSSYALERMESGKEIDLQAVLEQTGRKYASLRLGEEIAYAGKVEGEVYCTQRLHVQDGKMEKLEACIG